METSEKRSILILKPGRDENQHLEELTASLLEWVNDVVRERSIVVRSFFDDLWDGSVVAELVEILRRVWLDVSNSELLSAKEISCRRKWEVVLAEIGDDIDVVHLGMQCGRWGHEDNESQDGYESLVQASILDELLSRNPLALLQVLTQLARYHRVGSYPKLPRNVRAEFIRATRYGDAMETIPINVQLTGDRDPVWRGSGEADERQLHRTVNSVRQMYQCGQRHVLMYSLLKFVNQHVGFMTSPAKSVSDFSTGILLILLASELGGFFVRLDTFHAAPCSREERLHNCNLALSLLEDGFSPALRHVRLVCSAEDITDGDERSILQLLQAIQKLHKQN